VFDTVWVLPLVVEAFGNGGADAALASAGTVVTLAPFGVGVVTVGDVAAVALALRGAPPLEELASSVGGLV
jgi:hypothetical protein